MDNKVEPFTMDELENNEDAQLAMRVIESSGAIQLQITDSMCGAVSKAELYATWVRAGCPDLSITRGPGITSNGSYAWFAHISSNASSKLHGGDILKRRSVSATFLLCNADKAIDLMRRAEATHKQLGTNPSDLGQFWVKIGSHEPD